MGWFDGLLGGGGGGGGDYAGLLSGSGNIDYNKLLQQELANADNAKWAALSGALAEAGMPSRLPVPIGSAIGKAAAAFGGGENNSLLKVLQIQKLATETQSLKELSELRKSLPADMRGLMDDIIKVGGAPGAGQPDTPSGGGGGGGASGAGASPTGGGSDPRGKIPVITAAAQKYGIDPNTALAVARSEGLGTFLGDGGKSGGAFQLYTGGGVGNEFQRDTGLDPLDPKNEDATIDYALKHAAQNGWGPWNGAKRIGITGFTGIGENRGAVAGAASAPAAPPLPSAFNLPKFSGLLGGSTDAEQPSIQATPDGGGLLNPGTPSAQLRGDPSRITNSFGPPGTYKINSKGQPYSIELETMPPDQKAKVAEAMRSIKERMRAGGGSGGGVPDIPPGDAGGGDGGGFLPGDLAAGLTPGQGPLAIPRPAGLPPMPAATAAPLGGLLVPPQAPAASFAGPGPLATPQAPAAVPAAPPQMRSGPSYMPQMPPGMNEQQMLALQARIAQLRAKAALGGITGDPFAGYADLLKNSPNAQRLAEIIKKQAEYYGPGANPELQRALEIEKNRALYYSPQYDPTRQAEIEFGKRAGANPIVEKEKTQATEEDIRKAERTEFETRYGINQATGRLEEYRVRKGDIPSASAAPQPGAPGAPGAPAGSPTGGSPGKPVYNPLEIKGAENLVDKSWPAAKGAAQALQFTGMAKDLLDKGVFTGAGAGLKLQVAKVTQLFPGDWSNERIANTETFIATQARQVASFLASGALGTGQSITEKDLEFAKGIAAGTTALDEKTLRDLVEINEKYARSQLNQHNDSVKSFDPKAKWLIVPEPTPLELPKGSSSGARAAGAPPPGAQQIGTYQGKPVYQMPDGSRKVMQ